MSTEVWCWASIVCLRFLAERLSANGRGFSQVERMRAEGNRDGFLARLNDSQEKRRQEDESLKEPLLCRKRVGEEVLQLVS